MGFWEYATPRIFFGEYLGEDDIVRYKDEYGRMN